MKYKIRGDYFSGRFHLASLSGTNAAEDSIEKVSPADTDNKLWICPIEHRHVDDLIDSANQGFKTWRNMALNQRIEYLKNYQEQVVAISSDIAQAIALETGKPLWEAESEVKGVIAKVDVTINHSLKRIKTERYENILPNTTGHVYYRPMGPCLIIGPFNFPCHLANGQILNALIAGNSIIFKPSEKTIYSAQLLIECFDRVKFPVGVINFINGKGEIARKIIGEKSIKGIFFTGSKEVGRRILQETSSDLTKLVALELGGKNSCIVHKDANLDHALIELIQASFLTTGQRCVSTSKIVIHKEIQTEFIEKFHNLAKKIVIDHPIDHEKAPFMGPLIDSQAMENYLVYMGMAIREGAQEIMRGKQIHKKHKGYYVSPSIHYMEKFDQSSHFLSSEIFGPNCTFVPYNEIEEAMNIVNASEYGLAAGIFTETRSLYERCIENLDVGILNYNKSTCGASAKLPFGGFKHSGNYRPAGVAMIDSCVYPMSSLEMQPNEVANFKITGIDD